MSSGMILCERHLIKPHHPFYCECDRLTFLAKNLYNATLYYQRDSFFNKDFKSYYDVNKVFTHNNQKDYRALPAKVSKCVQQLVDKSFKSYFALVKKKLNGSYSKNVHIPKYLDKTSGRCAMLLEKSTLIVVMHILTSRLLVTNRLVFIISTISTTNLILKSKLPLTQRWTSKSTVYQTKSMTKMALFITK